MNPPFSVADKPPKPFPSPIEDNSPIESEILHYLILKTLKESAILVDSVKSCTADLISAVKAPFCGQSTEQIIFSLSDSLMLAADLELDLPLSESVVSETEMDTSVWHQVVPDSESESEMDPHLSDSAIYEMDVDFHLSDSMVGETEFERAPEASGVTDGITTAEPAAQTAVEIEKDGEYFDNPPIVGARTCSGFCCRRTLIWFILIPKSNY